MVVRRSFRNPKEVLDEFRDEKKQKEEDFRNRLAGENELKEHSRGMSAAKAKQIGK